MRAPTAPLSLAAVALLLLAAVYVLALGTSTGLEIDDDAIPLGLAGPDFDRAETATDRLLGTVSIGTLFLAGAGIVAIALVRRRPRHAVAAVALMAGANIATQLLKPLLDQADPLGGDAMRFSEGVFPSGHATVAMSLALALVIVVPPQVRPVTAVVAGLYAAVMGVGLLLLGWHFPSDVIGGFLLTAAFAAAAIAWLRAGGDDGSPPTVVPAVRVRAGVIAALLLAGAVAVGAAVAVGVRVSDIDQLAQYGRLHTAFFGGAAAIVALALALPGAVAALMLRTAVPSAARRARRP